MADGRVYDAYPEGSQPPYRSDRYGRTAAMGPAWIAGGRTWCLERRRG